MEVTTESLFTVAGATVAVGLVTSGIGMLVTVNAYWKRVIALAVGVVLMVAGAVISGAGDTPPFAYYTAAVLSGIVVALAASAGHETLYKGLDRRVLLSEHREDR